MMELLGLIALSGTSALVAGYGGRQLWRLGFRQGGGDDGGDAAIVLPPYRPITPAAFVGSQDQGAFGEALSFVMMAAQGWRPVNGKPGTGPQGIDGVFVRESEAGIEACLIETKTNASRYTPRQMADAKLAEDLTRLYLTCGDADLGSLYAGLYKALMAGEPWVSKQLWRHHLARGVTEQVALNRAGESEGAVTLVRSHVYMKALAAGVDELDRGRRYWTGLYPL